MKNFLFAVVLFPLLAFVSPDLTAISNALKKGDADELAKYFDSTVEIAILDEEDVYEKEHAKEVVRAFFEKNKPRSFNQIHQGTSKGKDSHYCIGNLTTGQGSFRVYILVNNEMLIQELRFDEE